MTLKEITASKNKIYAVGFKPYGRDGGVPLKLDRCFYRKNLDIENAFKSGKYRWINNIEIYSDGIITVKNPGGLIKIFAVDNISFNAVIIDDEARIKIITRSEFDNTVSVINNLTVKRSGVNYIPCAPNTKIIKTQISPFSVKLQELISIYGIGIFYSKKFKAVFLDFLAGDFKKEAEYILNLLKLENHEKELDRIINHDIY